MSESEIQQEIRVALNKADVRAWRNNIAKLKVKGRWINYGLPGVGGSDLIGLVSKTITQDMVGSKVAVFLAVEVKSKTGKIKPEQQRFIDFIKSKGGIAAVCRSKEEAENLIQ
jgi:hypothetical protein